MKFKLLLVFLALLVAVGLWYLIKQRPDFFHTKVMSRLGTVERTDLIQNVTIAGTIVPFKRTIFSPPYNAYVKKIYVSLGQKVNEGDPVVSLQQSLKGVHEEVYPMRAPFDGTIVQILHEEGEYVETAKDTSPIIRLDNLSRLFVSATVPETDVNKMKLGQKVVIKATAIPGKAYEGVIRQIFFAAVEKAQGRSGDRVEFQIRLEITNADSLLRPGMTTILDVITDRRLQVLALPHEYILKEKDHYFVTLENGRKTPIEVGIQNDEMFEIVNGVNAGDRVKMVDFAALPKES